jgi:long-chain acyl-CoA synthetase
MGLHRHIAFNANVFREWFQVGEGDVIAGIAPLFHITGIVAHMALSAISGAPLILAERFQAAEMMRLIEKWKATFTVAAITAFLAMLKEPGGYDLRSMKKCGTGGAPVPPAVVDQFEERFGVLIHNTYGLTESNSPSHLTPPGRRGPVDPASGALAIGLPVPNSEAKIVDPADPARELAPGEAGEIALRGPMMFSGYWEKPEATAKVFHDGYFLTGDIAVMDERGWFYIVDRKKDMIVASGFKVWPREVEDVLYQHPAVREAAVVGEPDEYRGETVRAVVALKDGAKAGADEIIAFCKERMAAYKYPRVVEFVEEIPKTATGKFLRRALRREAEAGKASCPGEG